MIGRIKLRVLFDDQIFVRQRHGGISRYFTEIIREYRDHPQWGVEAFTPFRYVVNRHLIESETGNFRLPPAERFTSRARVLSKVNYWGSRKTGPLDIVHHTYYGASQVRLQTAGKRVCTVYDMIPEIHPECFPNGNPHGAKRAYVMAADAVICISAKTKSDLLSVYGDLDKPVQVIPLAVSRGFRKSGIGKRGLPEEFVLFVGVRSSYKNFGVVLRGFAEIAALWPKMTLLCVGGPPFSRQELASIEAQGLLNRVANKGVADDELPAVYSAAAAFVFPSLYEGFGLPVLEAMAAGCPTILADQECFREVAADAAAFFDPLDWRGLTEVLARILSDGHFRTGLVKAGRLREDSFSWERTAKETARVYSELSKVSSGSSAR